ncbi:TatD family hydrolase [Amphritea balenae]|uniref:Hydrolase TatD n=1 Tax=Amphritea balenae TaxID=452629 RepID=A0A3P1SKV9_9GAMM|nr:TatD family hydrolase [Amphritea balenae]RRC97788.1 hydrolase TatD [Amphritea balenae]GGK83003.1 3'-5' ssDNA/RNA exonuclease TatD [Amphritea balenae]
MTDQQAYKLTDIGVNLSDSVFEKDRQQVIENAFKAGVERLIITGTTEQESEQAVELCTQQLSTLYCTAGVHPHYSSQFTSSTRSMLSALSQSKHVIAIGETGLDFNRNFSTPEQQVFAFEQQLEIAAETSLPLFLHERDAHKKQTEMLTHFRDHLQGGVAHCFTGTREELYNYLDLDLYIGITGWICDERRGSELFNLLPDIPADRLLLETDAPYLLPRSMRPKPKSRRNLPQYLPYILEQAALSRAIDPYQLADQCENNCERLFSLKAAS